jgi:hypothetical protein
MEDPAREALRWALHRIEAEVGPVLAVREEIAGTAPGFRLLVEIGGVGPAFAKIADGSGWSAEAVGGEAALLTTVRHRHMPHVLACGPAEDVPWMVLADLSGARWPPPWPDRVHGLHRALDRLARATPPPWLPAPGDIDPWIPLLAEEPGDGAGREPDEAWWRPHAVALAQAARRVTVAGDRLVHGDLGTGNICVSEGRPVLVDWSDAYVGNPEADHVTLAVDIAHTGGPRTLPPVADPPAWLAKISGLLIEASRREAWPGPGGAAVRRQQAELARTAVAWAVGLL